MEVPIENFLTEKQLQHIVSRCCGGHLVGSSLQPAGDGLVGFVGNHSRLTLTVDVAGQRQKLPLFVKSLPRNNDAKISFINENGFFEREMTVFKLIEEMETDTSTCLAKAIFYNDSILIMLDLAAEGYSIRNQLETFDLPHLTVALTSVARFHAAFANYETKKSLAIQRPYSLMEDHGQIIIETMFKDTSWIRTAAKLTANIIKGITKYSSIPDLEEKVLKQFLAGCEDLAESGSLNVLLHKDLWVNNIMFKYKDDTPINAILVDYQCVRYGPPAFDVILLLYLTGSRSFRKDNEDRILWHYFKIFTESIDADTNIRLQSLRYDYEEFLRWVSIARRFAMVSALTIFPFVLMDASTAAKVFDDPKTYDKLMHEDRTGAVLEHVRRCPEYGLRQVEVTEEFVERFLQS